jgi:hypothetical protein
MYDSLKGSTIQTSDDIQLAAEYPPDHEEEAGEITLKSRKASSSRGSTIPTGEQSTHAESIKKLYNSTKQQMP